MARCRFDTNAPNELWSGRQRRHFAQAELPMGGMLRPPVIASARRKPFNMNMLHGSRSPRSARAQLRKAGLLQTHGWTRQSISQGGKRPARPVQIPSATPSQHSQQAQVFAPARYYHGKPRSFETLMPSGPRTPLTSTLDAHRPYSAAEASVPPRVLQP